MVQLALRSFFVAITLMLAPGPVFPQHSRETMRIRFLLNGVVVIAALDDNATARDFYSMLPLTVRLEDFAATEKIAYLPRKMSTEGAPTAITPRAGDLAYYAPWGNLALFYRDFRSSPGLVKIGRLEVGRDAVGVEGATQITIERED